MSRYELFSPEGMRLDGRRFNDLRLFSAKMNTHPLSANGSCTLQQGNTRVICLVRGPNESSKSSSKSDLPFISLAINIHDDNRVVQTKIKRGKDKRLNEMANHITSTIQQLILRDQYQRTALDIQITVLSNDGGLLAACTNATILSLVDAGIAIYDYVAACCVGVWDDICLVDVSGEEERDVACVTIGLVGNGSGNEARIGLLVAEDRMPLDRLDRALQVGGEGCNKVRRLMDDVVRNRGIELIGKRQ